MRFYPAEKEDVVIQLSEFELDAVSGGGVSTSEGPGAVIGYLGSQPTGDTSAYKIAEQLKAYRAANRDSPTWYADFFNL